MTQLNYVKDLSLIGFGVKNSNLIRYKCRKRMYLAHNSMVAIKNI